MRGRRDLLIIGNELRAERGQAVRWSLQRLAWGIATLALGGVVLAASGRTQTAERDVRIADPSLKGCTVKGIVQATVKAPEFPALGILSGQMPPLFGVLQTNAIAELKQKAAALGANRIVLRHGTSAGTRSFHPRAGSSAEWEATTLTAEAYRC